jgi:ubiquinone/menaquinone biosynthesis C-methylase UbiE
VTDPVAGHYAGRSDLAAAIADRLTAGGYDLGSLEPQDLSGVDEFHIRGREATLELAGQMELAAGARVLDIGSGLGGPARTVAQTYDCHVTGVDLTQAFCEAAAEISAWFGLDDEVDFIAADATDLPLEDDAFDSAMTIHAAMNIPDKPAMFSEARRVVKPGGIFAVYDVLQGEGGEVIFPVPWARDPSISVLAAPDDMLELLADAGFEVEASSDSTAQSQAWFEAMAERLRSSGPPPVGFDLIFGPDFADMMHNQIRNLADRRIRTVTYVCRAPR